MKKHDSLFFCLLACLIIGGCSLMGWLMAEHDFAVAVQGEAGTEPTDRHAMFTYEPERDMSSTLKMDGKLWQYREELHSILLLGIDDADSDASHFGGGGRADTILVMILNTTDSSIQLLEVSRDTMVEVDAYAPDRKLAYSGTMQINMQHAFSDTRQRGAELMKDKISELLYGVPIDGCLSLTMEGIPGIVDALGGITVTMDADWSEIDPSYLPGAVVAMDGAAAERFLRSRDTGSVGSNDKRMDRQGLLMRCAFSKLRSLSAADIGKLLSENSNYIFTNIDVNVLKNLNTYGIILENVRIPGETRAGDLHDEYYVYETELRNLVISLFYKESV